MQKVNKQVKNHAKQYEYMYTIITCTLHIKHHNTCKCTLCIIHMRNAIQMYMYTTTRLPCSV